MQIQLDALGGVAGDMFVAAALDAFPDLEAGVIASVAAALAPSMAGEITCRLVPHNDGVLQGSRLLVERGAPAQEPARDRHDHHGHGHDHHDHDHRAAGGHHPHGGHRPWSAIEADLRRADLPAAVRDHALAIFGHLARVEASVHGIDVADVAFHEVGAWDSIADIVAAAHLIDALGAELWHVGALPLGSGRVRTAHGPLPVPAPATVLLLQGFAMLDDGIAGERVTPTGAAILRHLRDIHPRDPGSATPRAPRLLGRTGIGFGTKTLPGISNCLRLLVFDEVKADASSAVPSPAKPATHRELAVIEFEVDDQSAEDLAMGLDRLREHEHVFDVVQAPMFGKKGRMTTHVRALARVDGVDDAIAACFRETTTIGLRHHVVEGAALPRTTATVAVDGHAVRVKVVDRPGGRTAKAEADDALAHATHATRATIRREAERLALSEGNPE